MNLNRIKAGFLAGLMTITMAGCKGSSEQATAPNQEIIAENKDEDIAQEQGYAIEDIVVFRLYHVASDSHKYFVMTENASELTTDCEVAKENFAPEFGNVSDVKYSSYILGYNSPLDENIYYIDSSFMAETENESSMGYSNVSTFVVGDISYTSYTHLGHIDGMPLPSSAYMSLITDMKNGEVLDYSVDTGLYELRVAGLTDYIELDSEIRLNEDDLRFMENRLNEEQPHRDDSSTRI